MPRQFAVILLVLMLCGCAALPRKASPAAPVVQQGPHALLPVVAPVTVVVPASDAMPAETTAEAVEQPAPLSMVFGKTDFKGLLKTAYVRLTIVRKDDPEKKYFFYVGSKENQSVVPWSEGKLIEPGYFYLQLSPGDYQISAMAIPVGSTVAEEPMAVTFTVSPDKIFYLGTLDMTGTRERVKFGGVPVLKPGFEYDLSVLDDFDSARKDFESLLPAHQGPVEKNLLKIEMVPASP